MSGMGSEPSETWNYRDWFDPPRVGARHSVVAEAEQYLMERAIERHPFFSFAATSGDALALWVTQEIVVTGPVAQCILRIAAQLRNVHTRSRLVAVARGEHSPLRDGVASRSHPWLLHKLRESMGIRSQDIVVLPETADFLSELEAECADALTGVAAIGMGNERLLIPEYGAVKHAFAQCWPTCSYNDFLDANILEDERHSEVICKVAGILIHDGGDPWAYLHAAQRAVDS